MTVSVRHELDAGTLVIPAAGRSAQVAAVFAPGLVNETSQERPITVDQTNHSVVVGERIVVKWLLPPVPAPHPAVRLLTHLSSVGFNEMPPYFGALVEDGMTVAMVTGFVGGALDGWDWYVDELTAAARLGNLEAPLESASRLGELTARLHRALTQPSATVRSPTALGTLDEEADRGQSLLAEALENEAMIAKPHRDDVADDDAEVRGDRFPADAAFMQRASQISSLIEGLRNRPPAMLQPVHGDLHVGQILRSATTMRVNDFDGSPVVDHADRLQSRSPLIDLASMLQSIDHVGRVVSRRHPELQDPVNEFLAHAISTALRSYTGGLDVAVHVDEEALFALRVIQELHEFVYAARFLSRWRYVPEAAITALLPG